MVSLPVILKDISRGKELEVINKPKCNNSLVSYLDSSLLVFTILYWTLFTFAAIRRVIKIEYNS